MISRIERNLQGQLYRQFSKCDKVSRLWFARGCNCGRPIYSGNRSHCRDLAGRRA